MIWESKRKRRTKKLRKLVSHPIQKFVWFPTHLVNGDVAWLEKVWVTAVHTEFFNGDLVYSKTKSFF